MELDPSLGEPYAFLSYMYGRQHRHDEAIAAARTAIEREPGSFMGWYLLGITMGMRALERGIPADMARVIPAVLRAGAINPAFHPAWMMAGDLYALRGQYAHATKVLDKAIAVEKANTGFIFLGSYVQRAAIHVYSDELDAARPLLDHAIATYPGMDHVYAATMSAYAHFVRGCLEEHRGDNAAAEKDFRAVRTIADSNEHALGIGAHWVKSSLGLARCAHRRGDKSASDAALSAAIGMQSERRRFVWGWILGCADAATYYEIAATHATRGETSECLAALRKAVDFGWADMNCLNHDPAFAELRESGEIRQLGSEAATRVTLAPPVGSGGLPELP
jgi:tetratricopeptide (TPR) repeat protein